MTAPQEPPKPTMFLLTRTTWTDSTVIGLYSDKAKARAEADRLEAAKGQGDGWQEYYVNPIGVADAPARDDAAELRAAGHQSVRLIEWLSSREGTASEDAAEAEALVNRLRAALAASEGSE